jgi:hypothetical protein
LSDANRPSRRGRYMLSSSVATVADERQGLAGHSSPSI